MAKKFVFIGVVIAVVAGVVLILWNKKDSGGENGASINAAALAQCLTAKGVKEYGSYACSACKAQEKAFGKEAFKFVDYVECHPRGPNPQTELCLKRSIAKTPTWLLEEGNREIKRLEGFQTFEDLASFAGCPL